MFTERQIKIIELVAGHLQGIFGSKMAEALHVSDRTIRNEIGQINRSWKGTCAIEASNKRGYFISEKYMDYVLDFLYKNRCVGEQQPENRANIILGMLLFGSDVNIYDLSEQLYLSTQSVQREIASLQKHLSSDYGVNILHIEKDIVSLSGDEHELRELLFKIIKDTVQCNDTVGHTYLGDLLYKQYDHLEFEYLSIKIREYFETQSVAISSDSLLLIVTAIYICTVRNSCGYLLPVNCSFPQMDRSVILLIEELQRQNFAIYNGDLPLLNQFLGTFQLANSAQEENEISNTSIQILGEFCSEVLDKYSLDLRTSDDLYANMLLHIEYMLRRLKSGYEVVNPILNQVKTKYPYACEVAMLVVHIVYKHFSLYLRDDEISYIAVYIEHFIQNINQKLNCVIISSPRRSMTNIISKWLCMNFGNHLSILDCIPMHLLDNFLQTNHVDFILSTSEIGIHPQIPTYRISGIPDEQDQELMWDIIRKIRVNHRFQEIIKKNFCPPAIKIYCSETNFSDVIQQLSEALQTQDKIIDALAFAQDVLQREVNYPTNLCETFMIPHPLFTFAKKTAIAVAILKKPVWVGTNAVQLVFLLAIERSYNDETGVLFNFFKQLAQNKSAIRQLCEADDATGFLNRLIGFSQLL